MRQNKHGNQSKPVHSRLVIVLAEVLPRNDVSSNGVSPGPSPRRCHPLAACAGSRSRRPRAGNRSGQLLAHFLGNGRVFSQDCFSNIEALFIHGRSVLVSFNRCRKVLLVLLDLSLNTLKRLGRGDVGRRVIARQAFCVFLLNGKAATVVLGIATADGTDVSL